MNRTQDTHMIFIHGLASKPAESVLTECWKKDLIEDIHVDYGYLIQPRLSQKIRQFFDSMDGVGTTTWKQEVELCRDAYMDVGKQSNAGAITEQQPRLRWDAYMDVGYYDSRDGIG